MSESVGQLHIEVNVQLAKMQAQFDDLQRRTKALNSKVNSEFRSMTNGIKAAMSTLGAYLAPAALVAFGKSVIDLASNITDLSNTAGVNAQAFQTLAWHFMDSGVSMEELSKAFVLLRKNAQEAAGGNKVMAASFAALGIDPVKLQAHSLERQFEILAISVAGAKNQNEAFGAALDILGTKNAPKLLTALKQLGVEGLDSLTEKFGKWVLTPAQLDNLDKAGDKLDRLYKSSKLLGAFWLNQDRGPDAVAATMGMGFMQSDAMFGKGTFTDKVVNSPEATAKIDAAAAAAEKLRKEQADKLNAVSISFKPHKEIPAFTNKDMLALQKGIADATGKQNQELSDLIENYRQIANPARAYAQQIDEVNSLIGVQGYTAAEAAVAVAKLQDAAFAAKFGAESERPIDFKFDEITTGAKALEESMAQMWNSVSDRAGQAFADMVMTGKASFADLTNIIARTAIEMVARLAIINPLMNAMFGGFGSAGLLPAFFGAGATPVAGARAGGGDVTGGKTYLVGEEGPELFSPGSSGAIIPAGATKSALAGGGGGSFSFIYNIGAGVTRDQLMPILRDQQRDTIAKITDARRRG